MMVLFLQAVYPLWLHRNNVYNIAVLEQLTRMVVLEIRGLDSTLIKLEFPF